MSAATYDGATMRLYVNGALRGSTAAPGRIAAGNGELAIGNDPANTDNRFFRGLIDELKLYSRALSDGEIRSIYQAGSTGVCRPIAVTSMADELNSDRDCSLREAVRAANLDIRVDACPAGRGADTIVLPAGTFPIAMVGFDDDARKGDLDLNRSVTLRGVDYDSTRIAGVPRFDVERDGIIEVHGGADVVLDRLRISGTGFGSAGIEITPSGKLTMTASAVSDNDSDPAGGIRNYGTLELRNSIVVENVGAEEEGGAGGLVNEGIANVVNTVIADNFADEGGAGGIFNSGRLTLTDSRIYGNETGGTGGLYNTGTLTMMATTVRNNSGGITNQESGSFLIVDSTVASNAGEDGGILNIGSLTIRNSSIHGNIGDYEHGGIWNYGQLDIANSTISDNRSDGTGFYNAGGIFNVGTVLLNNVTIANNSSSSSDETSGGIYNFDDTGSITLRNTIVANNTGPNGQPADCGGTLRSTGYNLIGTLQGCTLLGDTATNQTGVDPRLGPLQSNGGATLTHALLAGSPAIDRGSPAPVGTGSPACRNTDQRLVPRPKDGNRDGTARCDIGAYELQLAPGGQELLPPVPELEPLPTYDAELESAGATK